MSAEKQPTLPETAFVNEVRLNVRQWMIAVSAIGLIVLLTPAVWKKVERFQTGPDYRIPYDLSKDYWLYQRRLQGLSNGNPIVVLGDSVVWGEYVLPDGTLSHCLSRELGQADRFINAGVNGLFPLALEGLIEYYGGAIHHQKVLLHCNLLWLSNPKADLQVEKEERFNHPRLVPQFAPRIPCYRADMSERLGILIERNCGFMSWVNHLQNTYFDQRSILEWTLADDGGDPPAYPNSYKNPLAQITLSVPLGPSDDPKRGPQSPRHKPWSANGSGATHFEWVDLPGSLQWGAFRRLTTVLRERGNNVLVVIGPFNEHLMASENRLRYQELRDGAAAALAGDGISCIVPEVLPSDRYADASHPLTEGYELLARLLLASEKFKAWLK